MMDRFQQVMADHLQKRAAGVPEVGNPAPFAVAPNQLMHGSQQPYAGRKFHELNPAQREERNKWMVDEASRMIAEKQQTSQPYRPFTPSLPAPPPYDPQEAQRSEVTRIASELAGRLAERDKV